MTEGQYQALRDEAERAAARAAHGDGCDCGGYFYADAKLPDAAWAIVARELAARDLVIEHMRDRAHGEIQRLQAELAARDAVIEQIRAQVRNWQRIARNMKGDEGYYAALTDCIGDIERVLPAPASTGDEDAQRLSVGEEGQQQ
jgi:hypothetical protein